tara:strand:+ start:495 stop:749 length:255 start_codon:yes stop_codon:yes gene_type:complete
MIVTIIRLKIATTITVRSRSRIRTAITVAIAITVIRTRTRTITRMRAIIMRTKIFNYDIFIQVRGIIFKNNMVRSYPINICFFF